jgi:predicted nucleotidyltransferase
MFQDNDYLVLGSAVYGIKGNWSGNSRRILVKPVYEAYENGNRKKIVDKRGSAGERFQWLDPLGYEHIRSRGLDNEIINSESIWGTMARSFQSIGINRGDIGYFGSYRLGHKNYKDIDFVLYGKSAHDMLRNQINDFKSLTGAYNLTEEHALYQAETHGRFYSISTNSLVRCLLNKWSSCMIRQGVCSTVRFVDPDEPTDLLLEEAFTADKSCVQTIKGVVSDAAGTSWFPRTFTLQVKGIDPLTVIVPLWIYHQCVKDGDLVEITGIVTTNKLIVRDYDHGIQHL